MTRGRYMVEDKYLYTIKDTGYTSPCWLWQGGVSKSGYGVIAGKRAKGVSTIAHKYYFILHKGEIPLGLQIDHLCRVKLCVNPDHMELVTAKINIRRFWKDIKEGKREPLAWNNHYSAQKIK